MYDEKKLEGLSLCMIKRKFNMIDNNSFCYRKDD
jgi:hypothetical protein